VTDEALVTREEFRQLEARIDARFEGVTARLGQLARRFDALLCRSSREPVWTHATDPETHEIVCRYCSKTVETGPSVDPSVTDVRMIEEHTP
jgi:hypothetical protein